MSSNPFSSIKNGLQNGVDRARSELQGLGLIAKPPQQPLTLSNQCRSNLERFSILTASRYYVDIAPPPIFKTDGVDLGPLVLLCTWRGHEASVPGIQFDTRSVRRYTVGLEEKKPVGTIYIDQQFSFISDQEGIIHSFFYAWMNRIITGNKYSAIETETGKGNANIDPNRYPGSVLYKKDYATTIKIFILPDRFVNDATLVVTLYNAYPVGLGDIKLSWGSQNQFVSVPVTFTFTHFQVATLENRNAIPPNGRGSPSSPLKELQKLGSAALTLSTIRRPQNIQDVLGVVNNAKNTVSGFRIGG